METNSPPLWVAIVLVALCRYPLQEIRVVADLTQHIYASQSLPLTSQDL